MLPSLFVGHGAPTIVMEDNRYTRLLREFPNTLGRPKGIVIFSAHWESRVQRIGCPQRYDMIYDFYGFPPQMYRMQYPASGDEQLAQTVQALLAQNGIGSDIDRVRGMDHGAWTPLMLMMPQADIPVVTMSVDIRLSPAQHYAIGRALAPLKGQGILVMASGGIVHNLRMVRMDAQDEQADPWAREFNDWIGGRLTRWDLDALLDYPRSAPHADIAVARSEHFVNLLLAMGAGDAERKATLHGSMIQYGNLSLDLWSFA